jgi:hypothetical protein
MFVLLSVLDVIVVSPNLSLSADNSPLLFEETSSLKEELSLR